jgi:DNA-binding response OmpR family regulator
VPNSILIVDDDPAIVSGVSALLEQAGYAPRSALGGAEACAQAAADPPGLVILDVMLPDMSGYEVCRRLRQLPAYVPILMLSARDETGDKVHGLDIGADDYLTKPFEPAELLARIRALLRFAAQRGGDQPLIAGVLRLDRATGRASLRDRALELTPNEWALLATLMEQPGRVFGRETLLSRVWEADYLGDSRIVDVCVQRLRSKLALLAPDLEVIQTVRGFGYRLGAL